MKIIAFVTETPSVRAILVHIGEPARPPALASARDAPRDNAPVEPEPDYDPLAQPEPEMEFDQRLARSLRPMVSFLPYALWCD